MRGVTSGARLADGVHGPLACADVDRADSYLRRNDGPNGGTTWGIVPYDEVLHGHRSLGADLSEDRGSERGRSVSLVRVGLDHEALVELGPVLALVLTAVVRVHSVRAIDRQEEALVVNFS